MATDPAKQAELDQLRQFHSQVLTILKGFQSNRLLDAETKQHQKNLERLLKETDKILAGKADKRDMKAFNTLVQINEESLKELKANNRSNQRFEKAFVSEFGDGRFAGSIVHAIAENMKTTIKDIAGTVNQLVAPLKQNAIDTSLSWLTGPFGKLAQESLNTQAISSFMQQHKQHQQQQRQKLDTAYQSTQLKFLPPVEPSNKVLGQFDGGINAVPQSGTYLLHKGERVIPPPQNQDLTRFLNGPHSAKTSTGSEAQRVIKVYEQGRARNYFDPLIDNENRLFRLGQMNFDKFQKDLGKQLEILESGIFKVSRNSASGYLAALTIWWKRFLRHPILNMVTDIGKVVFKPFEMLWHALFGKRKTDTQKIVDSNLAVVKFLRTGVMGTQKSWFQRLGRNLLFMGGVSRAEKTQRRVEREGYRTGFGGIIDRMRLSMHGAYIDKQKISSKARRRKLEMEYVDNFGFFRNLLHGTQNWLRKKGYMKPEKKAKGTRTSRRVEGNVIKPDAFSKADKKILHFADTIEKATTVLNRFMASMRARMQARDKHGRFKKGHSEWHAASGSDFFSVSEPRMGLHHHRRSEHNYEKRIYFQLLKANKRLKDIDKHTRKSIFSGLGSMFGGIGGAFGRVFGGFRKMLPMLASIGTGVFVGATKLFSKLAGFLPTLVSILPELAVGIGGILAVYEAWKHRNDVSGWLDKHGMNVFGLMHKAWTALNPAAGIRDKAKQYAEQMRGYKMGYEHLARQMHPHITAANLKKMEQQDMKKYHGLKGAYKHLIHYNNESTLQHAEDYGRAMSKEAAQKMSAASSSMAKSAAMMAKKIEKGVKVDTGKLSDSINSLSGKIDDLSKHLKGDAQKASKYIQQHVVPQVEDLGTYLVQFGR